MRGSGVCMVGPRATSNGGVASLEVVSINFCRIVSCSKSRRSVGSKEKGSDKIYIRPARAEADILGPEPCLTRDFASETSASRTREPFCLGFARDRDCHGHTVRYGTVQYSVRIDHASKTSGVDLLSSTYPQCTASHYRHHPTTDLFAL